MTCITIWYNNKSIYDYVRTLFRKQKRRLKNYSHLLEKSDIITLIV